MNKDTMSSIKAGIIGAAMGLIFSFLVNYFLMPVPVSEASNATGNGISGFISGFMGGFMGLRMHLKTSRQG